MRLLYFICKFERIDIYVVYAPGPGVPAVSLLLKREAEPKEKLDEDLFFELICLPSESRNLYPAGPGEITVEISPSTTFALDEWRTPNVRLGIVRQYESTCRPTLERDL